MSRRRALAFCQIHPLNFPIAWLASFFVPVYFWRSEWVRPGLLRRFKNLDPSDFCDIDDWFQLTESAAENWRETVPSWKSADFQVSMGGKSVDLTCAWLQWLSVQYERDFLFNGLVARWSEKEKVGGWLVGSIVQLRQNLFRLPFPELKGFSTPWFFGVLERAWWHCLGLLHLVRQLSFLLRAAPEGAQPPVGKIKYLWTGVSPSEMATGPNQLDFAFLCHRKSIAANEVLYVLPSAPPADTVRWCAKNGVRWSVINRFGSMIGLKARWAATFRAIGAYLRAHLTLKGRGIYPTLLPIHLGVVPWFQVGQELRPEVMLSSLSNVWPELPAVPAMNALGVRSTIWSYSANSFTFTQRNAKFRDRLAFLSLIGAKNVFTWNDHLKEDYFLDRSAALPSEQPKYWITGSTMCGDSNWMKLTPPEARKKYASLTGDTFSADARYISVFDVPTVTREMRRKMAFGPTPYPVEMLEAFFDDMIEMLRKWPDLRLILKPKRSLRDPQRDFAKNMWTLLNPEGEFRNKVVVLPHNVDPYCGPALADLCMGIPFTSPLLVGMRAGRPGIYHEPVGLLRHYRSTGLRPFVTYGRDELMARMQTWHSKPEALLNPEMLPALERYLGPEGDPIENLARFLRDL